MTKTLKIWISAGEPSGDARAAEFFAHLNAHRTCSAMGIAGPHMRAAGIQEIAAMESLGGMGLIGALKIVPEAIQVARKSIAACKSDKPDLAILVDFGEFHMRLGKKLRQMGIPVYHLAPPKIWAWGQWRVRRLQQSADAVGVLFPFEVEFYRRHGIQADYIGHPVAQLKPFETAKDKLLLLPGSRKSEIRQHVPILESLVPKLPESLGLQPVLGRSPNVPLELYGALPTITEVREVQSVDDYADGALALAASGTVNLELASLGIPQVVFYRGDILTYMIVRAIIQTRWVNPLNLVADDNVVPELIQYQATPEALIEQLEHIWERRDEVRQRSLETTSLLHLDDGLAIAAQRALDLVQ